MDERAEFEGRLRRDVARALRHIVQSGGDVGALDGMVTLHIEAGALVDVELTLLGGPALDIDEDGEVVDSTWHPPANRLFPPKKSKSEKTETEG